MIAHISCNQCNICNQCSGINLIKLQNILDICLDYTTFIEALYGEYRVFMDISKCKPLDVVLGEIVRELKAICPGIRVGAGKNKLIAKIASEYTNSSCFIRPENTEKFLSKLPVTKLWPLKEETQKDIMELGINTVGELNAIPEHVLYCHFGNSSKNIMAYAAGEDYDPLSCNYPEDTLIFTRGFQGTSDICVIKKIMKIIAGDIEKKLDSLWQGAKSLLLEISFVDGKSIKDERKFSSPVYCGKHILNSGMTLLSNLKCNKPVEQITLCLSTFSHNYSGAAVQPNLLDCTDNIKKKRAYQVVSKINEKFNEEVLFYGKDISSTGRYHWLIDSVHVNSGKKGLPKSFKWKGKWKTVYKQVGGWIESGKWWKEEGEKHCFLVATEDGCIHELFYDNKEKSWKIYSGITSIDYL